MPSLGQASQRGSVSGQKPWSFGEVAERRINGGLKGSRAKYNRFDRQNAKMSMCVRVCVCRMLMMLTANLEEKTMQMIKMCRVTELAMNNTLQHVDTRHRIAFNS